MTCSDCHCGLGVPSDPAALGQVLALPEQPVVPALHMVPRQSHAEHPRDAWHVLTMQPALDEDGAAAGSGAAAALQEQLQEQQREFNDLLACLGQESAKVPSGAVLLRSGARPALASMTGGLITCRVGCLHFESPCIGGISRKRALEFTAECLVGSALPATADAEFCSTCRRA